MEKLNKRNIQPFNGEKYSVWKFRVKLLLAELNVLEVVTNDIPEEITDEWRKSDSIAKSTIVEYLSDSFLSFASNNVSAKKIIQNLDTIYERRSLASQLALRKQLLSLKFQGDITLLQHLTTFDTIITDLMAAGASFDEMDKISHLLLTLPNAYNGLATALETLGDGNLTLAFVKTRLLDHEVKLRAEEQSTSKKVLNVNRDIPLQSGNNKSKKWKSRKQKNVQQSSKLYQKKSNSPYKLTKVTCEHCGRHNHKKSDCYYYKRMLADDKKTAQATTSESFAFMMGSPKIINSSNEISFLMDSGATDHIINREDLFSKCVTLSPPIKISVAKTGQALTATKRGTIPVQTNLGIPGSLENVLFAPDATTNLLSVRRMQDKGMCIIFDERGVTVQNGNKQTILTGDSCCFSFSLGALQKKLNQSLPGTHIVSLRIGSNIMEDVENGYLMHPDKQIEEACGIIKSDPLLSDGFNAIGFSQGAQFLRGLIQRCPAAKVKNLISLGGQHQGVYGLPNCGSLSHPTCDYLRRLLNHAAYLKWVQKKLVQATYWHDPLNEAEYKNFSSFLGDINNERSINTDYIRNLQNLENFVMVKFEKDTMVQPVETEWFGFYKPGQSIKTETLQESTLFTNDRLGLQEMYNQSKLHFLGVPGDHLRFEWSWFKENIIEKFLK